jgi:hypothetical protein
MQGYLLGRPMPAAEIEAQLRGNVAALERLKIIAAAGAPQSVPAAVTPARKSNLQR